MLWFEMISFIFAFFFLTFYSVIDKVIHCKCSMMKRRGNTHTHTHRLKFPFRRQFVVFLWDFLLMLKNIEQQTLTKKGRRSRMYNSGTKNKTFPLVNSEKWKLRCVFIKYFFYFPTFFGWIFPPLLLFIKLK